MENLVINHIYAVLGIAGLVSMIVTGCAIQAGDVLYKRSQRTQIKHELGKLKWTPLIAVCLSCSLLTSQLAFGQPAQPPHKRKNYETLFTLSVGIAVQAKNVCKTEACAKAADELTAVIADGQEKHRKGLLVEETRKQFHSDFSASMGKLRNALLDSLPEGTRKAAAENRVPEGGLSCQANQARIRPVQEGNAVECELCYDVLAETTGICGLYGGICPTCMIICFATAALAFGRCVEDWCQNIPPGFNDK